MGGTYPVRTAWILAGLLLGMSSAAKSADEAQRDSEQKLLQAAEGGDLALVRSLLEKGVDPDADAGVARYGTGFGPLVRGPSPLQQAARRGHTEVVRALLEAGADPRRKGIKEEPNQMSLPWLGYGIQGPGWAREALRELKQRAEPVEFTCGHPLGAAALGNHTAVLQLLVEGEGISPDDHELLSSGQEEGWTALMFGALGGAVESCAYLLEKGATPDLRSDEDGATALHYAAGRKSASICELLLKRGADPDSRDESGNEPLHYAAGSDAPRACAALLARGARADAANALGMTPLHAAAAHRALKACEALLAGKADPNARDWEGRTPLHFAALRGDGKLCEILLIAGADPLAATAYGENPLHLAAASGDLNTLLLFLQAGCPIDGPTALGYTPLHFAAAYDRQAAAGILSLRGAKVSATAAEGFTPLHLAVLENARYTTSLLLTLGAKPDAPDSEGWTPLHLAALKESPDHDLGDFALQADMERLAPEARAAAEEKRKAESREKLSKEPIARLLDHGADVGVRNADGETPLHLAAHADRADYCGLLLDADAQVNAETREGLTPLDVARLASSDAAEAVLLNAGGRPGAKSSPERLRKLLVEACERGDADECARLLSAGADPKTVPREDMSPLYAATIGGCVACVKLLCNGGADPDAACRWSGPPLLEALFRADDSFLEALLEAGADVNQRAWNGRSALHVASSGTLKNTVIRIDGQFSMAPRNPLQILLDHGAAVDAKDDSGATPLHQAAEWGDPPIAELLLESGADLNATNRAGQTPLDMAVFGEKGQIEALLRARGAREGRPGSKELLDALKEEDAQKVRELLEAGADPDVPMKWGATPLTVAAGKGNLELLELLVSHGADINLESGRGDTPLDAALRSEDPTLRAAEWLLERGAKGGQWGPRPMTPMQADLLLRFGFPMEVPGGYSWLGGPIYNAVTDFVKYLLDGGADANHRSKDGSTPLHDSVVGFEGSFDLRIVEMLLAHRADPDARDESGQTPGHRAAALSSAGWFSSRVFDERIEMLELLAAYGADLALRDSEGRSPRDLARRRHGLGTALWLRRWEIQKKLGILPLRPIGERGRTR